MAEVIKIKLSELSDALREKLMQRYGADTELEIYVHPYPDGGKMDDDTFWAFIDLLDWSKEGNDEAVVEPLVRALSQSSLETIFAFEENMAERLYQLDGERYAREIGSGAFGSTEYFSPDHFLDVRACIVANGREWYEMVLDNPKAMAKDIWFEKVIYVASLAYERKTGEPWDYVPKHPIFTYSNKKAWPSVDTSDFPF